MLNQLTPGQTIRMAKQKAEELGCIDEFLKRQGDPVFISGLLGGQPIPAIPSYGHDKAMSDGFLSEIKAILGCYFIGAATQVEDCEHATDLIVLRMEVHRFACRIRRFKHYAKYHGEFTIRASRPRGTKTELEKIITGWGDYLFYGFSDPTGTRLYSWFIGDLKVFRYWLHEKIRLGQVCWQEQRNVDNSSSFWAFPLHAMPSDFIYAESAGFSKTFHFWQYPPSEKAC